MTADPETLAELRRHDWQGERTINRLTAYTYGAADRYRGRPGSGEILPAGHDALDFAITAIEKLFSGERRWNRQKHPALLDALKSIVDSLLYNAVHSKEQRTTNRLDPETTADDFDEPLDDATDGDPWRQDSDPSALERDALRQQARTDRFISAAREVSADDSVLTAILDGLLRDLKPRDIAAALGLSAAEVYVQQRKLFRRVVNLLGPTFTDFPL